MRVFHIERATSDELFSCRYCQRETGSSYALNSCIEREHVEFVGATEPTMHQIPSKSGRGQWWVRCPKCHVGVFSSYGARDKPYWVLRGGTLDDASVLKPMSQIYTSTKQPWVVLSDEIPAFEKSYDPTTIWPQDTLQRFKDCAGFLPSSW